MSKQPKPTYNELKFLYDLILEGYSDDDILDRYSNQATFPCRTDKRFLRERRKELEAAEASLKDRIEKSANPLIIQRKREHFEDLAKAAQMILDRDLDKLREDENGTYIIDHEGFESETITVDQLIGRLECNLDAVTVKYGTRVILDCLDMHVQSEGDEIPTLYEFANRDPTKFIHVIWLLAQRKIFSGTCPVCKDWY